LSTLAAIFTVAVVFAPLAIVAIGLLPTAIHRDRGPLTVFAFKRLLVCDAKLSTLRKF
jgi:hypothetical protein